MRPTVHFTASSGWINDPHGITATDDGYEVFFQYWAYPVFSDT